MESYKFGLKATRQQTMRDHNGSTEQAAGDNVLHVKNYSQAGSVLHL